MRRISTLILSLFPLFGLFGQGSVNNLGFPSPNNDFLKAIGGSTGVGVDLYTGTAQINVPICQLTSKDFTVPVSLSYIGGRGVKVQDYATSAGLGWQIEAGGSISRVVRGFPDEFSNGYLGTGQWGKKVKQNLVDNVPLSGSDYTALKGWGTGTTGYVGITADGEPDLYYIKTPTFTVQFTFDENGVPVFNNESGIRITTANFFNSYSSQNSSFVVTDPNGTVYRFGNVNEKTTTTLYGSSYTYTSTWYLTSMVTYNNRDSISFNYISSNNNDALTHYQWTRTYVGLSCEDNNSDPIPMTIVQPKYLSSIVCPTGRISLAYAFDRQDITTSGRLQEVKLYSNGIMGYTDLKTFGFNFGYFGAPSTDPNLLRLRLDEITLAGGTTGTSTPVTYRSFTYNTSPNLPARNAQEFDYWGYYKSFIPYANPDPMANPIIRTASEFHTKANVLTNISELGGATWNISYEGNTYKDASGTNIAVGGLRVSSISKTLVGGELISTAYEYNDADGKSTGQILTEAYQYLVVNVLVDNCVVAGQKVLSESPVNIYDLNGAFVGYSSVKSKLQNGGYTVSNFQNFSDFGDVFSSANLCDVNVPTLASSISFSYKRGLLLSQVNYSADNVKISEEINTYTSLSSPMTKAGWAFRPYVTSAQCGGNGGIRDLSSSYYVNTENYRLSSIVHKEYDQITPANYIATTTNFTYCENKRTIKSMSTTDSRGNTILKTAYHAHDTGIPMLAAGEDDVISEMVDSHNNIDAVVHEVANKNGAIKQTHYTYEYIYPQSRNAYLTKVASYKENTLLTTRESKFETYASTPLSTRETGGKSTSVQFGYDNSYPIVNVSNADVFLEQAEGSNGHLDMFNSNYSYTFRTEYEGSIDLHLFDLGYLPDGVNIMYSIDGNWGNICLGGNCTADYFINFPDMPADTYTLELIVSMPPGTYFAYDLIYPVFKPKFNREYFYEGFEENGSAVSGNAHTGVKYWGTGSYPVNFVPPNSRNYIMQWWHWNNGKWIFNQVPYSGNTTLTGVIDDVRIFPADAQLTSYTYEPQVGQTGEIDPSGKTTTYEFDGLGRLNITRDNDKNILSKNCYNFAGQPVECPSATVYSSVAKSGYFTKNNCDQGYLGTQVEYSVGAGNYTSSISQADADQQALNDVVVNGQSYANENGSCYKIWYSVEKSGSFIRNNCGTNAVGSSLVYTVAAGMYTSTISQADADLKAQTDVDDNGQNYANANGSCTQTGCFLTMEAGYLELASDIASVGGNGELYLVFTPTDYPIDFGVPYLVATINGSCRPSDTQVIQVSDGANLWYVLIEPDGTISVVLMSSTSVLVNEVVSLTGIVYPL